MFASSFVNVCIVWIRVLEEIVPRPYGDTVHGTAPGEVVHFDFLYVVSSGPEGSEGLPEEDEFR